MSDHKLVLSDHKPENSPYDRSQIVSERSQRSQFFQIFGIRNRNPFPLFHWHSVDVGELYSIYNIGINNFMSVHKSVLSDHTYHNIPYERSQSPLLTAHKVGTFSNIFNS